MSNISEKGTVSPAARPSFLRNIRQLLAFNLYLGCSTNWVLEHRYNYRDYRYPSSYNYMTSLSCSSIISWGVSALSQRLVLELQLMLNLSRTIRLFTKSCPYYRTRPFYTVNSTTRWNSFLTYVYNYFWDDDKCKKILLLRCIHHFISDLINNMDHMRISGTEPSYVILSQTKKIKKVEKWCPHKKAKEAKAKSGS